MDNFYTFILQVFNISRSAVTFIDDIDDNRITTDNDDDDDDDVDSIPKSNTRMKTGGSGEHPPQSDNDVDDNDVSARISISTRPTAVSYTHLTLPTRRTV